MKIAITGSRGFIGKNLLLRLNEYSNSVKIVQIFHTDSNVELQDKIKNVDLIFHTAGVNRPQHSSELNEGNEDFTALLVNSIKKNNTQKPRVVFLSSIQAELDNEYGVSKKKAEKVLLAANNFITPIIYRLPNVFGKWCKPFYNSVVATFCHQIVNNLPVTIHDKNKVITLLYIDDLIDVLLSHLSGDQLIAQDFLPTYKISLNDLHIKLSRFYTMRKDSFVSQVGQGLDRALYSTLTSYLETSQFSYQLDSHSDARGKFVEFLKTENSGQVSFFTSGPGVTRGQHYHHTKTEKFLVVSGKACFRFSHLISEEYFEIKVSSEIPTVVQTIPGWTHDVINIGDHELICIIWANEIFDKSKPDTIFKKVKV